MQTFLPVADFTESAKILDKRRLWKQVVEASQILNTLEGRSKGWINHPAVTMWKGYTEALKHYYNAFWREAVFNRGVRAKKLQLLVTDADYTPPPWLGAERFHAAHRSNLLRKDKDYYSKYGWTEPDCLEYVWPTKERNSLWKTTEVLST